MQTIILIVAIPLLLLGMSVLTGAVIAWSMQGDE